MTPDQGRRRLAAILAADVAGYTRLVEQDTEGTVAAWKSARDDVIQPAVSTYEGRIVKLTGDGFLAEFSSVENAVSCAIIIQDKLLSSPLDFRIGIHLGDVIDDGDDIHGEGVNIAARIEALADSGGICISAAVHEQVRNRINATFEDLGERELKNVSSPVRMFRRSVGSTDATEEPRAQPNSSHTDKPSVAILPFTNMSGDAEQDYFSDGITEDIITALSRIHTFVVISRNSTFAYKGRSVDVATVARELGVRYVLEGSVRKAANRVRITTQLIDGDSAGHIWAEKYDRELADIFAVQDEITQNVVGALGHELRRAEYQRALIKPTANLGAWDAYHRGLFRLFKRTIDDNREARDLFELAIERDPTFAAPYGGICRVLATDWVFGEDVDREEAVSYGRKAVALDDRDEFTHIALGTAYWVTKLDPEAAIRAFDEAQRINPNDAQIYHGYGGALISLGRAEEAIPNIEKAMRLSPADAMTRLFYGRMASARLVLGDYQEAINWGTKAITKGVNWIEWSTVLAALGHAGLSDEATRVRHELDTFRPGTNVSLMTERFPIKDPGYLQTLAEGLRFAGVPEH